MCVGGVSEVATRGVICTSGAGELGGIAVGWS